MHRDGHAVLVRDARGVFGQRNRAEHAVGGVARGACARRHRNLDDAVALRLGEALDGGVERVDLEDVYRGQGITLARGFIEHRGVGGGRGNRHGGNSSSFRVRALF